MPLFFGNKSSSAPANKQELLSALRANDTKAFYPKLEAIMASDDFAASDAQLVAGIQPAHIFGTAGHLEAGRSKVWAFGMAAELVANEILSTDLSLIFRDAKQNTGKKEPRPDPELLRLLTQPNAFTTISDLLYVTVWHLKLCGEAYWLKDELNSYGQPLALYPLLPTHTKPIIDKVKGIVGYRFTAGRTIDLAPEDVIYFRRPDPANPLRGLGDVERSLALANEHINRTILGTATMANGGYPSTTLVKEQFDGTNDDWDKLKRQYRAEYVGAKNAGKLAFLHGKWTSMQLGLEPQKMQQVENSKLNTESILINCGIPLSVAGFANAANYATAKIDRIKFLRSAVVPLLNVIVDKLNSETGLVPMFNKELMLDFPLTGLIDIEQIVKDLGPLVAAGAITLQEYRTAAGYPKSKNPLLDMHYINGVPIELAGIVSNEPTLPPPAPPPTGEPAAPVK